MTSVQIRPWHHDLGEHVVGGSVYAVKPRLRVEAARRLTEAGCRVHADLILGPDHRHRGVSFDELTAIRRAVPTARIDVHLIVLRASSDPEALAEEDRAIWTATANGADFITVSPPQLTLHASALAAARAAGTDLWLEVAPGQPSPDETQTAAVDGALIMLIEPGTGHAANLEHLTKVERLAARLPVAVDGGVTRDNAARCVQLGACYAISGRDLFALTPHLRTRLQTHPAAPHAPALPDPDKD